MACYLLFFSLIVLPFFLATVSSEGEKCKNNIDFTHDIYDVEAEADEIWKLNDRWSSLKEENVKSVTVRKSKEKNTMAVLSLTNGDRVIILEKKSPSIPKSEDKEEDEK